MSATVLDLGSFDGFVSGHDFVVVGFLDGAADEAAFAAAAARAAQPQVEFATVDAGQDELFRMFGVQKSAIAIFRERVVLYFEPGIPDASRLAGVLGRAAALDMAGVHAELAEQHARENALATHRVCPTARRGSPSQS